MYSKSTQRLFQQAAVTVPNQNRQVALLKPTLKDPKCKRRKMKSCVFKWYRQKCNWHQAGRQTPKTLSAREEILTCIKALTWRKITKGRKHTAVVLINNIKISYHFHELFWSVNKLAVLSQIPGHSICSNIVFPARKAAATGRTF